MRKTITALLLIACYKMKAHRRFIWSSEVYAEREISKNLSEFPAPFSYNTLLNEPSLIINHLQNK